MYRIVDKTHKQYVFQTKKGKPLPQSSFKRMWNRLMVAAGCVVWREVKPGTSRPDDILKQIKVTLTPHYFRHNHVTMLYKSGLDAGDLRAPSAPGTGEGGGRNPGQGQN